MKFSTKRVVEAKTIGNLVALGYSRSEIAEFLGYSYNTITRRLERLPEVDPILFEQIKELI